VTRPPRLAWAAWIAVCIIWGTTYLGIRISLETVPPGLMAGLRWTMAGVLLGGVLAVRGERFPPVAAWPGLALLSVLMIGFGNGLVVWAEQYVPSGLTAVILATSPFWMVGVEAMLPRGERLTAAALRGLTVGFAGIVLLVWPDVQAGGTHAARYLAGIAALQLACAGWAVGSSWSKRHDTGANVMAATALQMLFGGVLMLAIGTAAGEWRSLTFSPRTGAAVAYLTLVGSIGGFVAYIYALRHLPVSTVSLYAYINPIIAVVLGTIVLGEPFGARIVAAAALVLAGLALVRLAGRPPAAKPRARNGRAPAANEALPRPSAECVN
jgi:drug/metabolite transporter (DMT)-like permease